MRRPLFVCSLLAALSLACATRAPVAEFANQGSAARGKLQAFVDYFSTRVERAADEIAQKERELSIERNTVYWKLRAIPLARRALSNADDQVAVLRLWVVTDAMVKAFASGQQAAFGASQPIAVDAAQEIESRVLDLAAAMLTPEQFEKSKSLVAAYVDAHLGATGLEDAPDKDHSWASATASVLKKPISVIQAPFSSLNPTSGLSDTALAVQNFTDEFHRARVQFGYMPSEIRWNTQLLLMEMEDTVNLSAVATGVGQIGAHPG